MKLPTKSSPTFRSLDQIGAAQLMRYDDGVSPQGCDFFKKAACAVSIAACVASGTPVPACLAAAAPHCLECL
ncbi:hypothetical protein LJR009_005394 [Bosea sp. LjRoot9]|uniref:hypothetical protein n=1 Tax=Bosea sp. LjRoot9 TaxID=3342341 RepID=UPI003ECF5930